MNNNNIRCILCGIKYGFVGHMFYHAKKDFYICNICTSKLYHYEVRQTLDFYSPASIYKAIASHVLGQDEAIKELSVTLFKHSLLVNKKIDTEFARKIKTNSILMGSTGTGKTYIMEIAAKILNIPILIVDATQLTATGYVGDDVEGVLSRMVKKAGTPALAEKGIIFIDEIDKIARKETINNKDIGGEAVQQELLRIIGGTHIDVNLDGKKPYSFRSVKLYTGKMLFIGAGCFDGISTYINAGSSGSNVLEIVDEQQDYSTRLRNAMVKYGFIPEFIGRFSSIVGLKDLTEDQMIEILMHTDSKLVYYKKLMATYGINVNISQDAIKTIAQNAAKLKIGARGIDDILEKLFNKYIYYIDTYPKDSEINIDQSEIYKIINTKVI